MSSSRIPRSLRRARPALAAAALAAAALVPLGSARALDPAARIAGHALLAPSGNLGAAVAVGPDARRVALVQALRRPGVTIGQVRVRLETSSAGAGADVGGSVSARDVVLLDGRVTIAALEMRVRAAADSGAGAAGIVSHELTGLVVDGVPVEAGRGTRVPVPGAGTLVLFEEDSAGARVRANAVRLEPEAPTGLYGAGASVVVGHLDAAAAAGEEPAAPELAPEPRIPGSTPPAPEAPSPPATTRAPAESPAPPPPPTGLPRREAPAITPQGAGYVFPVFGAASFVDDYGAPRAGTGTHHGNDIFAATGTPVLAVADGTLSLVGVNPLGGNRLWLTDGSGHQFYYAHLSAYAPAAVEGAVVRAGQVIAFVGNTGQAITTPPHLHFEIHPVGGEAVNPYPFLLAWQRSGPSPAAALLAAPAAEGAPAEGAVVVGVTPERDVAPAGDDGGAVSVS